MANRADALNLFATLEALLKAHPQGLTEYQVLLHLAEIEVPGFKDRPAGDTLNLFRRHFLLFHCLYRLRDQLLADQQLWLEIHCLKIVLQPAMAKHGGRHVRPTDKLRAYYLDLKNFEDTDREDVENMLNGFWKGYHNDAFREDALSVLGLQEGACRLTIKQRYRELALQHHPDRGGEPETFQRIAKAANVLLDKPFVQ